MNCTICEGKVKGNILYEDEESLLLIPEQAATEGHLQVLSKQHSPCLTNLKAAHVQHLFHLANYAAASLFETIQAQGTNILLNEGELFGNHPCLTVLSRKLGDGLNFQWEPKPLPPNEMEEIYEKIKEKMPSEIKEEKKGPKKVVQIEKELETVKDKIIDTPEKENYLIKQLERIP